MRLAGLLALGLLWGCATPLMAPPEPSRAPAVLVLEGTPGPADLTAVTARLAAQPGLGVRITGHTEAVGDEATARSARDAQAVADALIDQGISAGRLQVMGLGGRHPDALGVRRDRIEIEWVPLRPVSRGRDLP